MVHQISRPPISAKNERRQFIFATVIRKFQLEVGQVAIKFVHFYAHVSSIFQVNCILNAKRNIMNMRRNKLGS